MDHCPGKDGTEPAHQGPLAGSLKPPIVEGWLSAFCPELRSTRPPSWQPHAFHLEYFTPGELDATA